MDKQDGGAGNGGVDKRVGKIVRGKVRVCETKKDANFREFEILFSVTITHCSAHTPLTPFLQLQTVGRLRVKMDLNADEFLEADVKLRTNLGEGCIIQ